MNPGSFINNYNYGQRTYVVEEEMAVKFLVIHHHKGLIKILYMYLIVWAFFLLNKIFEVIIIILLKTSLHYTEYTMSMSVLQV